MNDYETMYKNLHKVINNLYEDDLKEYNKHKKGSSIKTYLNGRLSAFETIMHLMEMGSINYEDYGYFGENISILEDDGNDEPL